MLAMKGPFGGVDNHFFNNMYYHLANTMMCMLQVKIILT